MFPPSLQSALAAASHSRNWVLEVGDMKIQSSGPADTDDMMRAFPMLSETIGRRLAATSERVPEPVGRHIPPAAPSLTVPAVVTTPVHVPEAPEAVVVEAAASVPPVAALKPPAAYVPAGEVAENAPRASDLNTLFPWHMEKYARRKTNADTVSSIRRTLEMFIAVNGNKEAREVDYQDMQRFATALSRWPKFVNYNEDFKDKSIREILDLNVGGKYPAIKRSTQETHLQHLSAFFNEVIRWRRAGGNPNPVLTINRTKEYGSQNSHPKHAPDEIDWAAPMAKEVMDNVDAPHKLFGTLLLAYTGARTNEVCQLKRRDLQYVSVRDKKKVTHKVLCMKINTEAKGQHLKSANAHRLVPVPTQVLKLGIEDYLTDLDQIGAEELFPGLAESCNRPGKSLSNYHNSKLRTDWGVTDTGVTLHCYRHFITTMATYDCHVSPILLNALFGHSNRPVEGATGGEVLRGKRYVNKVSPLHLRDMLDELPFPELDITPYVRGRFDNYLCHEVGRLKAGQKRKGRVPKNKSAPAPAVAAPALPPVTPQPPPAPAP